MPKARHRIHRAVANRPGRDDHMVEEPKARKPLFDGALIGHIHHDRVHLPQLLLGLESLSWERLAIVTFAPASLARHTVTKPIPRLPRITTTCPPSSFIC